MQTAIVLDCRGTRISIERNDLTELPESCLLVLFPNGVVLSSPRPLIQREHADQENEDDGHRQDQQQDEDVYYVDFDAKCLDFVLSFFATARDDFYGTLHHRRDYLSSSPSSLYPPLYKNVAHNQNPLFHKQAIIVLREELEYFSIPPLGIVNGNAGKFTTRIAANDNSNPAADDDDDDEDVPPRTNQDGRPNKALLKLKMGCGKALLNRTSIFAALQRNVNRENNMAEQHLIDMLCMSGFEGEDTWGYRSLEPNRCCIASIALVLLKTGIVHPPLAISNDQSSSLPRDSPMIDAAQLATAQKLLLFWRKPARKCWWDATEVILDEGTANAKEVKVWARRVWTLELSLI